MLRMEKESDGHTTTLRLIGRIQSANIGDIPAQVDDGHVRYSWTWVRSLLWTLRSFDS
jgi:hypothetical protein